jgi:hypothetical protein
VSDIEPASSEVNQSLERAIWLLTAFNADAQDQRGWLGAGGLAHPDGR